MLPTRRDLLLVANALIGAPYIWGGKGCDRSIPQQLAVPFLGFDCSGFGTYVLWKCGAPDLRFSHWTAPMYEKWPAIQHDELQLFDPVFYATDGGVDHVMWYAGEGMVIGAHGGGSRTTAPVPTARVSTHPMGKYRDPCGFRSIREYVSG